MYCSTSNTCCGENGGYNGGGKTLQYTGGNTYYGSGGGVTDVRLVGGSWDNTTSLISRIMVAEINPDVLTIEAVYAATDQSVLQ